MTFKFAMIVVQACIGTVQAHFHDPGFDAFPVWAPANEVRTVHYFGTDAERFGFEKCMSQSGFPLEKVSE